jgi:hypothetical protein
MKILFCFSDVRQTAPFCCKCTASKDRGHVHLIFSLFDRFSLELVRNIFILNSKAAISAGNKKKSLQEDTRMLKH